MTNRQFFQTGDRVILDMTEPATADVLESRRISPGYVRSVKVRFLDMEMEDVVYTVVTDRPVLGTRVWSLHGEPGKRPPKLRRESLTARSQGELLRTRLEE